jgi:hypothetical protein
MSSTTPTSFDPLPIALRAFAEPLKADANRDSRTKRSRVRQLPYRSIVFDCETSTDATQRLRFGVYRLFLDLQSKAPGTVCIEEGIFYADDLPSRAPGDYEALRRHTTARRAGVSLGRRRKLQLMSRTEFVERVLWRWGHQQQATIVGFNLPFDLTRLAVQVSSARKVRGISLRLWEHDGGEHRYRPRIVIRRIDRHRHLMSFARTADRTQGFSGRFLDLATASFAHSDEPGLSLERACERFGVEFTKQPVVHGAALDDDYINYCREDVAATAALYRNIEIEHRLHPIAAPTRQMFSGASIAKQYLETIGIEPTAERLPGFPPELSAAGMAAFFGGRSECRIRRTELPVVYCDFKSMYPTCAALMGTWDLMTAEHLVTRDVTKRIQRLLERKDLAEQFFQPDSWRELHTLVKVIPNGAILPVRARYQPGSESWGVGVNPLQSHEPLWYSLGDVLASALLGPDRPVVVEAVQFVPEGRARGLRPLKLRGEVPFSPSRQDLFATLVEERERHRGEPLEPFLKLVANAIGFGIHAEFRRESTATPVPIVVYTDRESFMTTTHAPEAPGPYCFPPVAAAITGAARLMLALLEYEVTTAGGSFVFCDTDSMAIVATRRGGPARCVGGAIVDRRGRDAVKALSFAEVDRIVDKFAVLNPYDLSKVSGSILKIEKENYAKSGGREQLSCYAISPKRYQLVGRREVKKNSAHGLGHLLSPTGGSQDDWIGEAWAYLRYPAGPRPEWLDLPAVSRMTITGPEMLAWFAAVNHNKPYVDQVKPANFLLVAHCDPLSPVQGRPVAPYDSEPVRWLNAPWIDRDTGLPIRLSVRPLDGNHVDGVHGKTYGDVLASYLTLPDRKVLDHKGEPVGAQTEGVLLRRPVEAVWPPVYIGKEANDIADRAHGLIEHQADHTNTYVPAAAPLWSDLVVPALRALPTGEVARRSGVHVRTVQRAGAGSAVPHPTARGQLLRTVVAMAREALGDCSRTDEDSTVLHRFREASQSTRGAD